MSSTLHRNRPLYVTSTRFGQWSAALVALGMASSGCGGDEADFEVPDVVQSRAALAFDGTPVCGKRAGIWDWANELVGVVPGLGSGAKLIIGLSKMARRYDCGSEDTARLQIEDVRKIAYLAVKKDKIDTLQATMEDLSEDLMKPLYHDYVGLGLLMNKIDDAETDASTLDWEVLHVKANIAAMKYAVLAARVAESQGATQRTASLATLRTELKESLDDLARVEQDYWAFVNANLTDGYETRPAYWNEWYRGYGQLEDIRVDSPHEVSCSNVRFNCRKKHDEARANGRAMYPQVKNLHGARVFTPEYQELRAKLNSAYANLAYGRPRNECRIRNYWRPSIYLARDGGQPAARNVFSNDAARQDFYRTEWRLEEDTIQNAVILKNVYYNNAQINGVELLADASGSSARPVFESVKSNVTLWKLEHVMTGGQDTYRISPVSRPNEYLHIENGVLERGRAAPGWHSARWVFEGRCGRQENSTGQVSKEDQKLEEITGASNFNSDGRIRVVSRVRNVGRPTLKLAVESGSLVMQDLGRSPGVDLFQFWKWPASGVDMASKSHDHLAIFHSSLGMSNIQPTSAGNQARIAVNGGISGDLFTLHRLHSNVFTMKHQRTGKYLRAGTGVVEMSTTLDARAHWVLEDIDPGLASQSIEIVRFGKCLDLSAGNTANQTPIQQWDCVGNTNQKFSFVEQGEGVYHVVHTLSGKCMEVQNNLSTDGARIWLAPCGATNPAQLFKKRSLYNSSYQKLQFQIVNAANGKCIDLPGGSSANGAAMHQWTCSDSNVNQLFSHRP